MCSVVSYMKLRHFIWMSRNVQSGYTLCLILRGIWSICYLTFFTCYFIKFSFLICYQDLPIRRTYNCFHILQTLKRNSENRKTCKNNVWQDCFLILNCILYALCFFGLTLVGLLFQISMPLSLEVALAASPLQSSWPKPESEFSLLNSTIRCEIIHI